MIQAIKTQNIFSRKEKIARYSCFFLLVLAIIVLITKFSGMSLFNKLSNLIIILGLLRLANEPRLLFLNFFEVFSKKADPSNMIGRLLSHAMLISGIILVLVIFFEIFQILQG